MAEALNWVESPYNRPGSFIEHLDGIPWVDAEIPRRRHRCRPQSRGWIGSHWTLRCACGAICTAPERFGMVWDEKNSRRR